MQRQPIVITDTGVGSVDQRWEDLENEIYQLENGLEKELQVANHNIEDLKQEVAELRKLVAENLNKSLDTIE